MQTRGAISSLDWRDAYISPQKETTRAKKPPPPHKNGEIGKNGRVVGKIDGNGRVTGEIGRKRRITTGRTKAAAGTAGTITTEIVEIRARSDSYL